MRVGFIGLGTMGLPMAQRLLGAGHLLACSSRSPAPAEALRDLGATTPPMAGVVATSEVTFLCLPDDAAVAAVVRQILPSVANKTLVDCSTTSPATAVAMGALVTQAGGDYVDAPVSGGPSGARNGTLAAMIGGAAASFEKILPAISAFASHVRLVGGIGTGQVVKLCNQALVGAQMLALAECAELVQRAGIDASHLHDAILHSTGDCVMARTRFPVPGVVPDSPASNDWRPDFTTALMAKDLRIAADYANEREVPLGSVGVLLDLLARSGAEGNDGKDWSSFAILLAKRPTP